MPYARANPKARELAKAFEAENQQFLSKFFADQQDHFQALSREVMNATTDEGLVAKIADYIEVTHYKRYMGMLTTFDIDLVVPKFHDMINRLVDPIAQTELRLLIDAWAKELPGKKFQDILYKMTA